MAKGIFITGTGTGVGKTFVTRAIVRALVKRGIKVGAVKPVESGAEIACGRPAPADAKALLDASRQNVDLEDISVYCFQDPVSPHLAAARAGKKIEATPILKLLERHALETDIVVAEGAGGLLVPLSDNLTYADLIARTGFCLIIVAPNVLGSISATLLAIEAARSRGIEVAGVILNRTPPADLGNAEAISKHGQVRILGELPTAETDDDDALARLAVERLDLEWIYSKRLKNPCMPK